MCIRACKICLNTCILVSVATFTYMRASMCARTGSSYQTTICRPQLGTQKMSFYTMHISASSKCVGVYFFFIVERITRYHTDHISAPAAVAVHQGVLDSLPLALFSSQPSLLLAYCTPHSLFRFPFCSLQRRSVSAMAAVCSGTGTRDNKLMKNAN